MTLPLKLADTLVGGPTNAAPTTYAPMDPTNWVQGNTRFARKGMLHVNVEDYGAVNDSNNTTGNGTDNTTAIRNAISAARGMLSNAWSARVGIIFPCSGTGSYRVTGEIFQPPDAGGGAQTSYPGLHWIGTSRRASEIFFDSTAGTSTDPTINNLFTLPNLAYGWTFERLSFFSLNANLSTFYFWCTRTSSATYPQFGFGVNRDISWIDCEWRGAWKRGVGLDGDATANLNSEMNWYRCKMSSASTTATGGTTFADAFFVTGVANNTFQQQDQFLNYTFSECLFEFLYGTLLRINGGGSVNVKGGSWLASAATTSNPAILFKLETPSGRGISEGCRRFFVEGTRFEVRNEFVKVINSDWGKGVVTFINCDDSAYSTVGPWHGGTPAPYQANPHYYNFMGGNPNNRGPQVVYENCMLMGFHQVNTGSTVPTNGSLTYRNCRFLNGTLGATLLSGVSTTTAGTGFVQYTTTAPRVSIRNEWSSPDTPIDGGTP